MCANPDNDMTKPSENWAKFGQWMLERRLTLGLSQETAADLANIHRQQWYRIEKGSGTKRSTVVAVAKALQANPDEALAVAYGLKRKMDVNPIPEGLNQLSEQLSQMTRLFLSLPSEGRQNVLATTAALVELYGQSPGRSIEIVDDVDIDESDAQLINPAQG